MVHRLYVHNYRCLENFELLLADKPSALLIGRNGAGKSTVGSALELLQRVARGTNRIGQLVKPKDLSRGRSDVPMRFEIEAELQGQTYLYVLAMELPEAFKELRVLEEKLVVGGKPIYERSGSQVVLSKTAKDREAKFLVDWHLVALPVIQEQSQTDPLYIFRSWLARMIILAPIPSHITGDSEGDTLTPDREATNFGEWFSGLLAYSPAAYAQIDTHLREFLPDIADVKNPVAGKDFRSLTVQFRQGEADLSLPFKDLSDGEKCFFICAVVLAANKAYGPIFCFWDEPDSYLSLSEVGTFVMALRRSFEEGGQMLVTSHHSETVRKFSDENTFVLYRRSHLEPTLIRQLSEIQYSGDLVEALIRDDIQL